MSGSFGWRRGGNDFKRMGRGIEGRYERCRRWWEPHLACTREFIEEHLPPSQTVAVLGAGRLLDVDLGVILERCAEVHLYDADPSCVAAWKRQAGGAYGRRVLGFQSDITDTMEKWSRGADAAQARGMLAAFLRDCKAPVPQWSHREYSGVISLNVLGQIPLYWRDRIATLAPNTIGDIWRDLEHAMAELQRAHVDGVLTPPGAWSILITDSEYYFYQSEQSQWRMEPALFGGVSDLVHAAYAAGDGCKSWLWHVAPQYVECEHEGEIHKVEAFFRRGNVIR
jgi:hypothetical protein